VLLARSMPGRNERASEPTLPDTVVLKSEALPAEQRATGPATERHVYECPEDGLRVFSDERCGTNATVRSVQESNTFTAPPIAAPTTVEAAPRLATAVRTDTARSRKDCEPYEAEVKRWDERMRRGYRSAEGEYLRAQRSEANDAFYACIRRNRMSAR
jgi:hypothetical protein